VVGARGSHGACLNRLATKDLLSGSETLRRRDEFSNQGCQRRRQQQKQQQLKQRSLLHHAADGARDIRLRSHDAGDRVYRVEHRAGHAAHTAGGARAQHGTHLRRDRQLQRHRAATREQRRITAGGSGGQAGGVARGASLSRNLVFLRYSARWRG